MAFLSGGGDISLILCIGVEDSCKDNGCASVVEFIVSLVYVGGLQPCRNFT
jgi:hypothetical protein